MLEGISSDAHSQWSRAFHVIPDSLRTSVSPSFIHPHLSLTCCTSKGQHQLLSGAPVMLGSKQHDDVSHYL